MRYEEIQALLDRYWEGETSLDEERRIKAYFGSGPIDERLKPVAPMFQALREEQSVQLLRKGKVAPIRPQIYQWAAAASVALLLAAGWWMFSKEKETAPMAAQPVMEQPKLTETPVPVPPEVTPLVEKNMAQVAPVKKKAIRKQPRPQPEIDPETAQAMAEIKAALALVSAKLDKGRNEAIKGATYLESVDKVPKRKDG